jgi:hypothetical protein
MACWSEKGELEVLAAGIQVKRDDKKIEILVINWGF